MRKKLLLLLLCVPMIGFGQEIIKDFDEAIMDCYYFQELCWEGYESNAGKAGDLFYKYGEKRIKVTFDIHGGWTVIFYYKNGKKESERGFNGCNTAKGPYTTWWENGNLKFKGKWDGDDLADEWYENGQIKKHFEYVGYVGMEDGCVTKAVCYYESGQIKKLVICDDIYGDDETQCFEVLWGNMDYCIEECFDKEGKKIECK